MPYKSQEVGRTHARVHYRKNQAYYLERSRKQYREELAAYRERSRHPSIVAGLVEIPGPAIAHCGAFHPVEALPWSCPTCGWTLSEVPTYA